MTLTRSRPSHLEVSFSGARELLCEGLLTSAFAYRAYYDVLFDITTNKRGRARDFLVRRSSVHMYVGKRPNSVLWFPCACDQ